MGQFDEPWAEAFCDVCDPVFAAADVGFERQILSEGDSDDITALLWEADARLFAARYPDSGIVEAYGRDKWAGVHCIDYWVYVDAAARTAELRVEGWNSPSHLVPLKGDGARDGRVIGDLVARILRVPPPAN